MVIKIITNQIEIGRGLDSFSLQGSSTINLELVIKASHKIEKPKGSLLIDQELVKWVYSSEGNYCSSSICVCEENSWTILCRADVNHDWSQAEITYLRDSQRALAIVSGFLLEVIFRNRIIFEQGIVIHASAVSYEGQGIIFTAPSETGKSTQAKLWADYLGARVLNDDRPALRLETKRTYVHGTPWSGKKMLFNNEAAPLKAIVVLEQASVNKISRLPASTSVSHIIPRCFLPYYDGMIMEKCLRTLGEMFSEIPVYRLECKPDREAVELVCQCLH